MVWRTEKIFSFRGTGEAYRKSLAEARPCLLLDARIIYGVRTVAPLKGHPEKT